MSRRVDNHGPPAVRRRRGGSEPAPGAPAWMLTFSDLVTQVLAFFILLYTFSSVDAQKFRDTMLSLQGALGVLGGAGTSSAELPSPAAASGGGLPAPLPRPAPARAVAAQTLGPLQGRLRQALAGTETASVELELLDDRLVVRFKDQALFDSGDAILKPEALPPLDAVAEVLGQITNRIRVEGHTDDIPISTLRFPSNWELSAARAAMVVRYLQEFHSIDPQRLEASGAGEWHPVTSNATPAGRARNRRVDIVILSETLELSG